MNVQTRLAQFTPAEAEKITGVSVALQRKWRREGHGLPSAKGWTRWDREGLARLLVLGHLAELVGPARAVSMIGPDQGGSAAALVALQATKQPGASEGVQVADQNLPRFAVSIGGGPITLPRNLLEALEGASAPAIVLDLEALGKQLAQRAGRPLIICTEAET